MTDRPLGPPVDATPRPLPPRTALRGAHVVLEPLHVRHAAELWLVAEAGTLHGDASWDYLGSGPIDGLSRLGLV
jgi:hypothetical protein